MKKKILIGSLLFLVVVFIFTLISYPLGKPRVSSYVDEDFVLLSTAKSCTEKIDVTFATENKEITVGYTASLKRGEPLYITKEDILKYTTLNPNDVKIGKVKLKKSNFNDTFWNYHKRIKENVKISKNDDSVTFSSNRDCLAEVRVIGLINNKSFKVISHVEIQGESDTIILANDLIGIKNMEPKDILIARIEINFVCEPNWFAKFLAS